MTESPPTTPKPRRRWLQFSLRTALVLVLICSIPCGWLAYKLKLARDQREAVQAIRKGGGGVLYDYHWSASRDYTRGIGYLPSAEPKTPKWLVDRLGIDMFATVIWVWLPREATDRDLQPLAELSSLEFLCLNESRVTDEGLRCLQGAAGLRCVTAFDTKVTAEGAAQLESSCPGCTVYYGSFEELLRAMED